MTSARIMHFGIFSDLCLGACLILPLVLVGAFSHPTWLILPLKASFHCKFFVFLVKIYVEIFFCCSFCLNFELVHDSVSESFPVEGYSNNWPLLCRTSITVFLDNSSSQSFTVHCSPVMHFSRK